MSEDAQEEFQRNPDDDPDAAILPSRDLLAAQAARFAERDEEEDEDRPRQRRTKPNYDRHGSFNSSTYSPSATSEALEKLRGRERFFERLTWAFATVFILSLGVAVVWSNQALSDKAMAMIARAIGSSPGPELNCRDPKNIKTAECVKKRELLEAEWRAIMRNQEGKVNPFAIHGKD